MASSLIPDWVADELDPNGEIRKMLIMAAMADEAREEFIRVRMDWMKQKADIYRQLYG